jgi:hypothetical protein
MISILWNNISTPKPGVQILIGSNQVQVKQQTIDLNTVFNRGELVGILIETINKVASPGAAKNITTFYAFSNYENRVPAELATAAGSQVMELPNSAAGTRRTYSLPIVYQGGRYLHIWFTSDTFTDASAQAEIDLSVMAKTMN